MNYVKVEGTEDVYIDSEVSGHILITDREGVGGEQILIYTKEIPFLIEALTKLKENE